jgi:hypothetical protein
MKAKGCLQNIAHHRKSQLPWCLIAVALAFVGPSRAEEASLLKAGVARVNLTPPMEMKAALGGYGARMSKPAIGVHDAVWAKTLVLTKGEQRFALVALTFWPFRCRETARFNAWALQPRAERIKSCSCRATRIPALT